MVKHLPCEMNGGKMRKPIVVVVLLVCFYIPSYVDAQTAQCTFPTSLIGQWKTSVSGTWTITADQLTGYKLETVSPGCSWCGNAQGFNCHEIVGTKYVLQTQVQIQIVPGLFRYLYNCIDVDELAPEKFVYYLSTLPAAGTNARLTTTNNSCTDTPRDNHYSYHVTLKSGSETASLVNCPAIMFSDFHYTVDGGSTCDPDTTSIGVIMRQQLLYNYTLCPDTRAFSMEGVLDCVYYVEDGGTYYVTLYNEDNVTPDETTYFSFTCMVMSGTTTSISLTANPRECDSTQTPTTATAAGYSTVLTSYTPQVTSNGTATGTAAPTNASKMSGSCIAETVIVVLVLVALVGVAL